MGQPPSIEDIHKGAKKIGEYIDMYQAERARRMKLRPAPAPPKK